MVTGAEPVVVSLQVAVRARAEHWALLGGRAGQGCPESHGGGQGLVPTAASAQGHRAGEGRAAREV